ncbi:putative pentatricopeptide repeat-containing protein At3g16890, mitochondrial [Aristolochia californica]|uniref:putative pentatricopeptide repeat-containing protein At3g16890, mitochondrial n=1 Tax=Aristolochia californica TaxID=171875 RepID=UPI0035DD1308
MASCQMHRLEKALSNFLYRKGTVVQSVELLQEIKCAGLRVTKGLFCILINSWGKLGLAKYCMEVFSQMFFLGFKPNTRVYNSLIHALVKSNSLDMAYFKLQQMAADNCHNDRFTYNILIHVNNAIVNIVKSCLIKGSDLKAKCKLMNDFVARDGKPAFNDCSCVKKEKTAVPKLE